MCFFFWVSCRLPILTWEVPRSPFLFAAFWLLFWIRCWVISMPSMSYYFRRDSLAGNSRFAFATPPLLSRLSCLSSRMNLIISSFSALSWIILVTSCKGSSKACLYSWVHFISWSLLAAISATLATSYWTSSFVDTISSSKLAISWMLLTRLVDSFFFPFLWITFSICLLLMLFSVGSLISFCGLAFWEPGWFPRLPQFGILLRWR